MIATWMIAATLFGVGSAVAATALDRALRLIGRQARIVWLIALAATLGWPLLAPLLFRPVKSAAAVRMAGGGLPDAAAAGIPTLAAAPSLTVTARALLERFDRPLAVLWGAATLLLLLRAGLSMRALRRLAALAEPRRIDGQSVLVSSAAGPAAFGILAPHIVLPRWSLDLEPEMREMVLRHEREHLAASDPAVFTLAWLVAALMPWNPALWHIARRLRVATELDCDHRVLQQGTDAQRYARLLLLISQRQTPAAFAAPMAGSPSTLHERISAMHATRPAQAPLRVATLVAVALVAGMIAASPALASELAVAARFLPKAPVAPQTPGPGSARPAKPTRVSEPNRVRELPLVVVSPDRSVEVPFQQPPRRAVADTTKRPAARRDSARVAADSIAKRAGYVDFKVDTQVVFAPGGSPSPSYPDILRSAGVSGEVVMQIVIDTSGLPLPTTLKVVRKSHDLFDASVRAVVPQMRFVAATVGEQKVRQLIQLIYRFEFAGASPSPVPLISPNLRSFIITVTAPPR
ncbi:MAG: TonB family protein [Gemmatimonadetes bacterium]|nr:TonB family protein [Gemmatimonadota bacterium]